MSESSVSWKDCCDRWFSNYEEAPEGGVVDGDVENASKQSVKCTRDCTGLGFFALEEGVSV